MRKKNQSGQAIILVVLAVGIFLMGGLGLAVDTGQLYGHRQMAQAAADAAAEAGILSVFSNTNTSPTNSNPFGTADFTCKHGNDGITPCAYARLNGFDTSTTATADQVDVSFPTSVPGVTLSPDFTPNAVKVIISRKVDLTFIRLLGAAVSKTVKATATAAIIRTQSPVPLIVLHPTMDSSFLASGGGGGATCPGGVNCNVLICGGPKQSIQVNSSSPTAVSIANGQIVDLARGGPLDVSGDCSLGTGSDFGVFGGPETASPTTFPSWFTYGTTSHYYSHNPKIRDPLLDVPAPDNPVALGLTPQVAVTTGTGTTPGDGDCPLYIKPSTDPKTWLSVGHCVIYHPGIYVNGLLLKGGGSGTCGMNNECVGIFHPGIYYMDGYGDSSYAAFATNSNADMIMCSTTCVADTSGCCSKGGMLVYMSKLIPLDPNAKDSGVVNVTSQSSVSLKGSDGSSVYKGILFFNDRKSWNHTGTGTKGHGTHGFTGSGSLGLQGTIYLTNTETTMYADASHYQVLNMAGGTNSNTLLQGQIIVDSLNMGGGGVIQMNLNSDVLYTINQVALVN